MTARNPFRHPTMRGHFDEMLSAYNRKSHALFRDGGSHNRGSSVACYFWNGFYGINPGQWDAASRKLLGYACYRAGQASSTVNLVDTPPRQA